MLHAQALDLYPPEFITNGLCSVFSPFWVDLSHSNIFLFISSNILHQLHQGVFKDHLKKWNCTIASKKALDTHFQAMPVHFGLHHFTDRISKIKQ